MKKSANCLARPELRKLEDMVEQHRAEILAGKWTMQTFADYSAKKMGRPVTTSNVRGACVTMGVQFPCKASASGLKSNRQLRAAVLTLTRAVIRMSEEVGCEVGTDVRSLLTIQEED